MKTRVKALNHAIKFIGVTESPPGSNRGHNIDQWNKDACGKVGAYWFASFGHGMFKLAGKTLPGGASVLNVLAWAKSAGDVVTRPRRGDLACLEFGEGAWDYGDHIGFVERVLAVRWKNGRFSGWIQTVEGNTSRQGMTGSQSNGGGVFRRRRWLHNAEATFVRVPN